MTEKRIGIEIDPSDHGTGRALVGRRPWVKVAVLLFAVALWPMRAGAEAAASAASTAARKQAGEMYRAFVRGDMETFLDHMHPKVLEAMGGKQKAVETIKKSLAGAAAQGLTPTERHGGGRPAAGGGRSIQAASHHSGHGGHDQPERAGSSAVVRVRDLLRRREDLEIRGHGIERGRRTSKDVPGVQPGLEGSAAREARGHPQEVAAQFR